MPQTRHADRGAICIGRHVVRSNIQAGSSSQRPVAPQLGNSAERAVYLLDRFVHIEDAFRPRMPGIKNLALFRDLGPMGVTRRVLQLRASAQGARLPLAARVPKTADGGDDQGCGRPCASTA